MLCGLLHSKSFFNPQPSPPLHSKLGCLLFSTGSSNSGTTLHGEEVVKRPKGPLEHNVCTNFVGDRTFLPADIRQALPRGRGVGGDVLVQANEQTEIGPGNKSLRRWLLVSNPRVGTNHEELIWTFFFFFLQLSICERRKPTKVSPQKIVLKRRLAHGWPRGWRWFSDREKLQAPLLSSQ